MMLMYGIVPQDILQLYSNEELSPYEMAKYLAQKLEVDFLDASVPADKKWIEFNS